MTGPTLAERVRVGDRLRLSPSWEHGEHNGPAPARAAVVTYIHPQGRYCTVQYGDGLTDTVQLTPEALLCSKAAPLVEPEAYQAKPNQGVRDRLRELGVAQTAVSVALGYGPTWLNRRLEQELTQRERLDIINAAQRIAAERSKA